MKRKILFGLLTVVILFVTILNIKGYSNVQKNNIILSNINLSPQYLKPEFIVNFLFNKKGEDIHERWKHVKKMFTRFQKQKITMPTNMYTDTDLNIEMKKLDGNGL